MALVDYKNPELFALAGVHLLPLWDEKLLFTFAARLDPLKKNSLSPFPQGGLPYPLRQRRLTNVSVDDSMLLLKEAIRDNQSYFHLSTQQAFRVTFPYAFYMKKGDLIDNLTSGEQYTIAKVYDPQTKDVLLAGKTRPKATDRLRLRPENEIVFTHGFPRSFSKGHKFDEEGSVPDKPAPWNEAVTYIVTRSVPGTVDASRPFEGVRNMKPKFRESVEDPLDPVLYLETDGWFFDNLVRFDCWSKTNAQAVKILNWFEDFILRHTWIFEVYGITKVLYWGRDEDEEIGVYRNDVTKRSITFYFKTERLFFTKTRKLSHVSVDVNVTTDESDIPDKYEEAIPEPTSSADWPEPTSSIDANLIEGTI